MTIKLRKPEPNEERLSWCNCIDEGWVADTTDEFKSIGPGAT